MFKRLFVEEWALCIPFVSFFIFAIVFIAVTVRALRISKSERERMASLPLEEESTEKPQLLNPHE
jgi:cbb3-type cytochrome oxidase subunit 3